MAKQLEVEERTYHNPVKVKGRNASAAFTGNEKETSVLPNRVIYHGTTVFEIDAQGSVHLSTGGHKSNTTKKRMSQAAKHFGIPMLVYSKRKQWWVLTPFQEIEFTGDKLTIEGLV